MHTFLVSGFSTPHCRFRSHSFPAGTRGGGFGGRQSAHRDPHHPYGSTHTPRVRTQGRTPLTAAPQGPHPPMDRIPPRTTAPPAPHSGVRHCEQTPPPPELCHWEHSPPLGTEGHGYLPHYPPQSNIRPPPPPAALLDSRVSFLWALGGGLQTPGSFSPALSTGLAVGAGTESPPAPGGSLGGGGGAGEGLPGGSAGLEAGGAGGALGGVLGAALSPSGLGKLGIFSRFTTGMNKLGRNGAVRGGRAAPGGGGVGAQRPPALPTRGCCPSVPSLAVAALCCALPYPAALCPLAAH